MKHCHNRDTAAYTIARCTRSSRAYTRRRICPTPATDHEHGPRAEAAKCHGAAANLVHDRHDFNALDETLRLEVFGQAKLPQLAGTFLASDT